MGQTPSLGEVRFNSVITAFFSFADLILIFEINSQLSHRYLGAGDRFPRPPNANFPAVSRPREIKVWNGLIILPVAKRATNVFRSEIRTIRSAELAVVLYSPLKTWTFRLTTFLFVVRLLISLEFCLFSFFSIWMFVWVCERFVDNDSFICTRLRWFCI